MKLSQCSLIDPVSLVELAKISVERCKRNQILQSSGTRSHPQSGLEHSLEPGTARLVDAQRDPSRCVSELHAILSLGEKLPRIGEAMGHRCDLSMDKRSSWRFCIQRDQLADQRTNAVESSQVAEKLRASIAPARRWTPRCPAAAGLARIGSRIVGERYPDY